MGLYSLVTLVVTARAREIGVRMTLGTEPRQIVGQLLAGVGRLLAAFVPARRAARIDPLDAIRSE